MEYKSWQAKGEEIKQKVKERKETIQEAFRPKKDSIRRSQARLWQHTTGNTARRFVADTGKKTRITGVDIRLIHGIAVVLQSISSGEKIDLKKFTEHCNAKANLYVELFPWYYMPSSLQKLLIHGPQIVKHLSVVPIGFLSEEAAEVRNKDFRKYRSDHSWKSSSIAPNQDILHNLLLSSDPLLSNIRRKINKKEKKLTSREVKEVLVLDDNEIDFTDVSAMPEVDSDCSDDDSDVDSDDIDEDET